jgi:hypothetical protein
MTCNLGEGGQHGGEVVQLRQAGRVSGTSEGWGARQHNLRGWVRVSRAQGEEQCNPGRA